MQMTDAEILQSYRGAKDPVKQIGVLVDLNCVKEAEMARKLQALGVSVEIPPEKPQPVRKPPIPTFDVARALELHAEGLCDLDIAERLGVKQSNFAAWRRGQGLKANVPSPGIPGWPLRRKRAGTFRRERASNATRRTRLRSWKRRPGPRCGAADPSPNMTGDTAERSTTKGKMTWRSAESWAVLRTQCIDGAGNWACRQMPAPGESTSGRRHLYEKGTAPFRGGILKGPPDRRREGLVPDCPGQGLCRSPGKSRRESAFRSGPDRAGRSRAFSCSFRYLQRSFRFAAPPFSENPCFGNTLRFW